MPFFALEPERFTLCRDLFAPLSHHLVIESILAGLTPGRVFVDDRERPETAVAWFKRRLFFAGQPRAAADLNRLITDVYYPEMTGQGLNESAFTLVHTPGWERVMDVVLAGKEPLTGERRWYHLDPAGRDWEPEVTAGFTLRPVDAALLADPAIQNPDYVCDEMVSERPSVADFLDKSFGYCVIHQNEIVGWCMSEYNVKRRCELGIETAEAYQRMGLARATAVATIKEAVTRGYQEIGWICDADNQPSIALAEHLGFTLGEANPTLVVFFDPMINRGVHGNIRLRQKQYREALTWYEKALALGNAPIWLLWNNACAHARLDQTEQALVLLHRALDAGFTGREQLINSEHFQTLHGTPQWKDLLTRLPG